VVVAGTELQKAERCEVDVIGQLESRLPSQPFVDEWAIIKADPVERVILRSRRLGRYLTPLARYAELSVVEQVVPLVFLVLFIATLIRALT
jgi:hypothetical protein